MFSGFAFIFLCHDIKETKRDDGTKEKHIESIIDLAMSVGKCLPSFHVNVAMINFILEYEFNPVKL